VDSRSKIVTAQEARSIAAAGATVVSGFFDPLVASHAQRLAGLKQDGTTLLVLISTPPDPILPARARAELVASLGVVDHVAESVDGLSPHLRLEQEDVERLEQLMAHVHARQRAASS